VQREGDGEVKGVIGGFVDDDEAVFGGAEAGQVDVVLGRGEEVAQLAQLGLEGDLVEEVDQVDVGRVGAEVGAQEDVEGGFEHEGVVDGHHAYPRLAVPAGVAPSRVGGVHDVVADEEEGLEQLREPAEGAGEFVLGGGERGGGEEGAGVDDGEAAVVFSAEGIIS